MTPEEQAADKFIAEFEAKKGSPMSDVGNRLARSAYCIGYVDGRDTTAAEVANEMLAAFKSVVKQMEDALAEHNAATESK